MSNNDGQTSTTTSHRSFLVSHMALKWKGLREYWFLNWEDRQIGAWFKLTQVMGLSQAFNYFALQLALISTLSMRSKIVAYLECLLYMPSKGDTSKFQVNEPTCIDALLEGVELKQMRVGTTFFVIGQQHYVKIFYHSLRPRNSHYNVNQLIPNGLYRLYLIP